VTPTLTSGAIDRLIVTMRTNVGAAAEQDLHQRSGALSVRPLGSSRLRFVSVPRELRTGIADTYRGSALVESVDMDQTIQAAWTPTDPQFGAQWALATIGAPAAWDVTGHGATSIRVAVLDSGIDANHPDLAGRVALSADFSGSGTGDRFGHGTAVAGIIAAGLNNGVGIAGISTAFLLDGKVLGDGGVGSQSAMLDGIVWATDHGARVINLSVGTQSACSTALQTMIDYAWNHGAVIVAAAGNDASRNVVAPASCSHVIAVGATDATDARAGFSDYGSAVSLAAPGVGILTTDIAGGYSTQDGTSLAAAHVSGAAAAVWSTRWGTANQGVVDRLLSTAKAIPGTGSVWRAGRLDLAAAVGATEPSATPSPTPSLIPPGTPTPIPTGTASSIATPSATPVATWTPSPTSTPAASPTTTPTPPPTATPSPTSRMFTPTPAVTATPATPLPSVTPTEDPLIYPLACTKGITLTPGGGVTVTPNVDPSSGTNATGTATATITYSGGGCSTWTLQAKLPANSLPAGTVQASCNGSPPVSLSTTATTVCTGPSASGYPITYTIQNSWSLTNQTTTLSSVTWTVL